MRRVFSILVALLCLFSIANGQKYLGQTKSFIVKDIGDCYIYTNTETFIVMECSTILTYCLFDRDGLCNFMGFDASAADTETIVNDLIYKRNFRILGRFYEPLLTEKGKVQLHAWGTTYINSEYIYTILSSSVDGTRPYNYGVTIRKR